MIFRLEIIAFLFSVFLGVTSSSVLASELPDPKFEIYRVVGTQKKVITSISGQAKWSWEKVGDGVQALKVKASFNLPEVLKSATVTPTNSQTKVSIKDQKLNILTSELESTLNFKTQQNQSMQLSFKFTASGLIFFDQGCQEMSLQSKVEPKSLAFYIGLKCNIKPSGVQLSLSLPSEAEVENSSLHDLQGKGESWKLYEFGNLDAAKGEVANFKIRYLKQVYNLSIVSVKQDEIKKKGKEAKFAVGLGYDSLKYDSSIGKFTDSKPIFFLKGLPYSLFWRIGMGIDLEIALALSKSDNNISFLQFLPYGYLRIIDSPGFLFEGRGYFSITTQAHAASGGGYQLNQVGAGAKMGVRVFEPWWLSIESRRDGLGSNVVNAHLFADVSVMRRSKDKSNLVWGAGYQFQDIKINETVTLQDEFSQSLFYLMAEF